MKEKIARQLFGEFHQIPSMPWEKVEWEKASVEVKKWYYEGADQILTLITEEIGRVENPYWDNHPEYRIGFERCLHTILSLFKGGKV